MYQYSKNSNKPNKTTTAQKTTAKQRKQKSKQTKKKPKNNKNINVKLLFQNEHPVPNHHNSILRQKPLSFNKDNTVTGMTLIFSVFIYLNILERRIQHGVWKGSLWGGKKVKESKRNEKHTGFFSPGSFGDKGLRHM